MKTCTKCKERKSLESFTPRKRGKDGLDAQCKDCVNERQRKYRASKTSEERLAVKVWGNYKLSLEDYYEMVADGCAICGATENLCIDHDHACCPGTYTCGDCVVGVLCREHNLLEGYLKTTENTLKMYDYILKKEQKRNANY